MKRAIEIVTDLSRYAVGILFVFSGIVKANDPLGFSYKLEEYFVEFPELGPLGVLTPMFDFLHENKGTQKGENGGSYAPIVAFGRMAMLLYPYCEPRTSLHGPPPAPIKKHT